MKILNFGSCNIDYVYSLDHIVAEGETETAEKLELFPGGKGLNQSIAIARAGANVFHAGCVGADGEMLKEILRRDGVDLSYLKPTDVKNGHAIIQVDKGGRNSIFIYPGSNGMVTEELIDGVLAAFSQGDMLLLQNEISSVPYIIERAHALGMCIVFNPSPFNEKIGAVDLSKISCLILNEVEGTQITGANAPEEILLCLKKRYPHLKVMLTLGEKGCVYADEGEELWQSAFCVTAVDTTAAGDTFTGYFVAGLAEGAKMSDILKTASAASAIAVSRMGAAPSIPYKSEVLKSLPRLAAKEATRQDRFLEQRIEKYMKDNVKNASLAALAEELGYSAVYTGALVKRCTGRSFTELLQTKRCQMAAELLENTVLPVGRIIELVGYENESFFREKFKEKYGKTPLKFRKKEKSE